VRTVNTARTLSLLSVFSSTVSGSDSIAWNGGRKWPWSIQSTITTFARWTKKTQVQFSGVMTDIRSGHTRIGYKRGDPAREDSLAGARRTTRGTPELYSSLSKSVLWHPSYIIFSSSECNCCQLRVGGQHLKFLILLNQKPFFLLGLLNIRRSEKPSNESYAT
jgi:hypothetical protein